MAPNFHQETVKLQIIESVNHQQQDENPYIKFEDRKNNENQSASNHDDYQRFKEDDHRSNRDHNLSPMELMYRDDVSNHNDIEIDDYNYDDEEIQRDAANDTVACIVYIALGFFMVLFFGVTVSIVIIVGKYGFVVCIILSVLLCIMALLGKIIFYFMEQDRVLRPMRKKMRRWHAIATAVVVNEFKNFHLDLNDHLLLTYDENYQDDQSENNSDDTDINSSKKRRWRRGGDGNRRRGPRSKLFGLLVQPLLKKKNGQNRFSRKKKKNATSTSSLAEGVSVDDHAFV